MFCYANTCIDAFVIMFDGKKSLFHHIVVECYLDVSYIIKFN